MTETEKFVKDWLKLPCSDGWSSFRHAVARRLGVIAPINITRNRVVIEHPPRSWSVPNDYIDAYKKYRG